MTRPAPNLHIEVLGPCSTTRIRMEPTLRASNLKGFWMTSAVWTQPSKIPLKPLASVDDFVQEWLRQGNLSGSLLFRSSLHLLLKWPPLLTVKPFSRQQSTLLRSSGKCVTKIHDTNYLIPALISFFIYSHPFPFPCVIKPRSAGAASWISSTLLESSL